MNFFKNIIISNFQKEKFTPKPKLKMNINANNIDIYNGLKLPKSKFYFDKLTNYVNDEITQGYFKDLQTIFIHNYLINDSLLSNMKVCLDEKNFDQVIEESSTTEFAGETDISNPPSNNIHEPTKFINWLDYLYAYLEDEKRKDRTWAGDLLDKLDQEYFLMENKYLSQFFFEEYGLQSIPDCICKKKKKR